MKFLLPCILFGVLLVFSSTVSKAQENGGKEEEIIGKTPLVETNVVGILYPYVMSVGFASHSNGFSINYRKGKNTTGYTKRIFEIEAATIKHAKEFKVFNPTRESKGYIFGKSNALLALRASIGEQRVIASKTDMGGIEIRVIYMAGLSLGILKPVYLKILEEVPNTSKFDIVTEKYDPDKHSTYNIYGKAPVLRGVDELALIPGGFAKFGMSFDYGNEPTKLRTLEVGMMLDAFPKKVPIMADIDPTDDFNPNNMFFFGFYVSLNYGKRW
ncbi:MAG: hypothetical protein JKY52_01890 [Flavobacteriales bacterium]|nr:hypothetical protein [Flavobacteriales bacterium]